MWHKYLFFMWPDLIHHPKRCRIVYWSWPNIQTFRNVFNAFTFHLILFNSNMSVRFLSETNDLGTSSKNVQIPIHHRQRLSNNSICSLRILCISTTFALLLSDQFSIRMFSRKNQMQPAYKLDIWRLNRKSITIQRDSKYFVLCWSFCYLFDGIEPAGVIFKKCICILLSAFIYYICAQMDE